MSGPGGSPLSQTYLLTTVVLAKFMVLIARVPIFPCIVLKWEKTKVDSILSFCLFPIFHYRVQNSSLCTVEMHIMATLSHKLTMHQFRAHADPAREPNRLHEDLLR